MRKKQISIAIFGFSILVAMYLLFFVGNTVHFSEYQTDATMLQDIMSGREENAESLLTALYFNEQKLVLDIGTNTWYYSLDEARTDALDPSITFETEMENVQIVIEDRAFTNEVIAKNQSIRMIAYNETGYSAYMIKGTLLPIMEITHAGEVTDENTPMYMRLYDNRADATQRVTVSDGWMHIRGGTSRSFAKNSFKLSLLTKSLGENIRKNDVSLLGMRQDDDWVLYAAYNDQEKIRNVFSSNLWHESCADNNSFGLDNGVEYRYIELFMNGQYYGLYALGYKIDERQVGIDETNIEHPEYMYKKTYWDPEFNEDYDDEKYGDVNGYELETPESEEAWLPLREYYGNIYTANPAENSVLFDAVDVGSAIDVYIYLNLIQGADHVDNRSIHNVFLTAKWKNGKYVILYSPWDMDQAWGNIWANEGRNWCEPYGVAPEDNYILQCGSIAELVNRQDQTIWKMIVNRYWELREEKWSNEHINELIDGYEVDIYQSGAYLRDMERWPEGSYTDPEKGLSDFRQYVIERLRYTDMYYASLQ